MRPVSMALSPRKRGNLPGPVARALSGWQPARVLMTAHKLGIFDALGKRYLNARQVAEACGTHPRSTWLLLNACVALGFLDVVKGCYGNSPEGIELLVRGQPDYLGHALDHQDREWHSWGRLEEAVRSNQQVSDDAASTSDGDAHQSFIRAVHTRGLHDAEALADNLDLTGRKRLFDAGGGAGTHSVFLVRRYPGLTAVVFDLPTTEEVAREVIAESGLQDRISFRAGDLFRDDFGRDNDVILLSAVLHLTGPERCGLLLRKAFASLTSGGLVVVHEGLMNPEAMSPPWAALFSLSMLVDTGEGRSYSATEISAWMRAAGFSEPSVTTLPRPANTSLIVAAKP